jgi:ferredoxin
MVLPLSFPHSSWDIGPLTRQPKKPKEDSMKVRINKQCMGDRNCHKLCPEVFEYDEDQLLAIVKFDVIPEQYHELVRRAARECVPQAIEIEE